MSDQAKLLSVLEAHGKQFLQSFNSIPGPSQKLEARTPSLSGKKRKISNDESEEEWNGIQDGFLSFGGDSNAMNDSDFEQEDDNFTAESSVVGNEKVVVFSENTYKSEKGDSVSKSQMKAFMSSKTSKVRNQNPNEPQFKRKKTTEEEEDERTNAQNDALLHKLVHTQLLSGSLNPDLEMTPAHRRKALAGRVMELAGTTTLGKGEREVREAEKNKAAKHVREGLTRRQKERQKQELEDAKNLGNYHPTLKKLFEASSAGPVSRPRPKSLKMGGGTFRGGVLRLSSQEIASVTGALRHTSGKRGRSRK